VPGEQTSPTHPIPTMPRPLARQKMTVNDLTDVSAADNALARQMFAKFDKPDQMFVPPGFHKTTLHIPGALGGNEWGGMAGDRHGVIYAAVSNGAQLSQIVENPRYGKPDSADGPQPAGGYQNGYAHLKFVSSGGRPTLPDGESMWKGPLYTLNAVDLNTGEYRWTIPVDSVSGGGPVVTQSGLLFIGSGGVLKAYDTADGKVLFSQKLPSTQGLTPAVYMVDGKEYVAIASGGRADSSYVAYALP
jgi:quinoprotein glucose dehydrogenase